MEQILIYLLGNLVFPATQLFTRVETVSDGSSPPPAGWSQPPNQRNYLRSVCAVFVAWRKSASSMPVSSGLSHIRSALKSKSQSSRKYSRVQSSNKHSRLNTSWPPNNVLVSFAITSIKTSLTTQIVKKVLRITLGRQRCKFDRKCPISALSYT